MRMFQVDAFTDRVFSVNPAAVLVLDNWLDDALMLSIAQENNLAETAFAKSRSDGTWICAGLRPLMKWISVGMRPWRRPIPSLLSTEFRAR